MYPPFVCLTGFESNKYLPLCLISSNESIKQARRSRQLHEKQVEAQNKHSEDGTFFKLLRDLTGFSVTVNGGYNRGTHLQNGIFLIWEQLYNDYFVQIGKFGEDQ